MNETNSVRVVDLFAGVGGFAVGLRQLADELNVTFDHVAAVDVDGGAMKLYEANHAPLETCTQEVEDWIDEADVTCDLLLGGPPCQGFSRVNWRTRYDDERNSLYYLMALAAEKLEAKAVVIENVEGVKKDHEKVVDRTIEKLIDIGYHVSEGILRSDKIGAPQSRRRHFLVARRDHQPPPLEEAEWRFGAPPMTVDDVLSMPMSVDETMTKNFETSPENVERIDYLFDNDLHELPTEMRPPSQHDGSYQGSYNRLRLDQVAPTVTTRIGLGNGRYVHPTERRLINLSEAAAFQEFPPDFIWRTKNMTPTKVELGRWIGNAVPGSLARAAAWCALTDEDTFHPTIDESNVTSDYHEPVVKVEDPAHGTVERAYVHRKNTDMGIHDPMCDPCRKARSLKTYATEVMRMGNPWYRITEASKKRKRQNVKLDFPLSGSRADDVALLIADCEERARSIYERMGEDVREMTEYLIAEAPMTAEEAILSVADHMRINA